MAGRVVLKSELAKARAQRDDKRGAKAGFTDQPLDPFTTESTSDYSNDEFYTRATDGHGHSDQQSVRLPPDVAGVISKIVQSGQFPEYETAQALIRDAVVHRLHHVTNSLRPHREFSKVISLTIVQNRIEADVREMQNMEAVVETMSTALKRAVDNKDWKMLSKLLQDADETIEACRDPYKSRLQNIVREYRQVELREVWNR